MSTDSGETDSTTDPVTVTVTDTEPPMTSTSTTSMEGDGSSSSSTGQGEAGDSSSSSSTSEGKDCGLVDAEDNDDQDEATGLGNLGCDDGSATVDASLEVDDPDWFTFFSPWDCGNTTDPVIEVSIDVDATVCAYISCTTLGKTTELSCVTGAADTAANGALGCCGTGAVEIDANCNGGADESMDVWISVGDGPTTCVDYEITYEVTAV